MKGSRGVLSTKRRGLTPTRGELLRVGRIVGTSKEWAAMLEEAAIEQRNCFNM